MKRLIKTRAKIEPFKIYQLEDCYIAELNDVEVFRTKHQHLATSHCVIKLSEERNLKNTLIHQNILQLKKDNLI